MACLVIGVMEQKCLGTIAFIGEVGSEINIKAYIPGMEIVLQNLKEEWCLYFWVQGLSREHWAKVDHKSVFKYTYR